MNRLLAYLIIASTILLVQCGDPSISIEDVPFEPKIVVDGYLYPGEPVQGIYLKRNFELNTPIDSAAVYLKPDINNCTASINGVPLVYDSEKGSYYTNDLNIDYGSTYTLTVDAIFSGVTLNIVATTESPQRGFEIVNKELGDITYRDEIMLRYKTSPGTGFYLFSIRAEDASPESFIYDNAFFPGLDTTDVKENFNAFKYQFNLMLNVDGSAEDIIEYEVIGLDTWFYGNYKMIVYAGNDNMKDYFMTSLRVQGMDGNFVEPKFHFDGNGIGVFGSAIRDTLTFNLIPSE